MNNEYTNEARKFWGEADAYGEYSEKTKNYTKEQWSAAGEGLMAIFSELAACKGAGKSTESAEAQALVAKLQSHITEHYYTCTTEILSGLGAMYLCDERFKGNIDRYGEGTAEYAAYAIKIYCKK